MMEKHPVGHRGLGKGSVRTSKEQLGQKLPLSEKFIKSKLRFNFFLGCCIANSQHFLTSPRTSGALIDDSRTSNKKLISVQRLPIIDA